MPTNPTTPNANASVDRLALGVEAARGTEPSFPVPVGALCFEAEASAMCAPVCACVCFEME